ncbi:unnamed protein product [Toxocara canis]|uniref:Transposase n=1 Tax=Toxocara canis TaxID=6265 RepID=A0A183U8N1_TOXCA|nr:unnamed protein product [Toxocara canis]
MIAAINRSTVIKHKRNEDKNEYHGKKHLCQYGAFWLGEVGRMRKILEERILRAPYRMTKRMWVHGSPGLLL